MIQAVGVGGEAVRADGRGQEATGGEQGRGDGGPGVVPEMADSSYLVAFDGTVAVATGRSSSKPRPGYGFRQLLDEHLTIGFRTCEDTQHVIKINSIL